VAGRGWVFDYSLFSPLPDCTRFLHLLHSGVSARPLLPPSSVDKPTRLDSSRDQRRERRRHGHVKPWILTHPRPRRASAADPRRNSAAAPRRRSATELRRALVAALLGGPAIGPVPSPGVEASDPRETGCDARHPPPLEVRLFVGAGRGGGVADRGTPMRQCTTPLLRGAGAEGGAPGGSAHPSVRTKLLSSTRRRSCAARASSSLATPSPDAGVSATSRG